MTFDQLKTSDGMSYTGAIVSIISGLTLTDWGIVLGIVTGILTFAITRVYQYREHKARMALYAKELAEQDGSALDTLDRLSGS